MPVRPPRNTMISARSATIDEVRCSVRLGIDEPVPPEEQPEQIEQRGAACILPAVAPGDLFLATPVTVRRHHDDYVDHHGRKDGTDGPIVDTNGAPKKDFHTYVDQRRGRSPSDYLAGGSHTTCLQVRYNLADAGEVFLVWGINDWKVAPGGDAPKRHHRQKRAGVHADAQEKGSFVANLYRLPTALDYAL